MPRFLAVVLLLGGLAAFLVLSSRKPHYGASPSPAYEAPAAAPKAGRDWWENEDRPARPVGITQGVRDRVNRAMETGAKRAGGDQ